MGLRRSLVANVSPEAELKYRVCEVHFFFLEVLAPVSMSAMIELGLSYLDGYILAEKYERIEEVYAQRSWIIGDWGYSTSLSQSDTLVCFFIFWIK